MTVSTFEEALYGTSESKIFLRPRDHFMRVTGYQLSAKWDGKPIMLAVDCFGRFFIFKPTLPESYEAIFAAKVCEKLVVTSYLAAETIDADCETHSC